MISGKIPAVKFFCSGRAFRDSMAAEKKEISSSYKKGQFAHPKLMAEKLDARFSFHKIFPEE